MLITEDIIADISPAREKFFGCSGKMLLPSPRTVAALLAEIPQSRLITKDLLQQELARRAGVEVTCPSATQTALRTIAKDPANNAAYWRVVKKNGELISWFPGGVAGHAGRLAQEGHVVDTSAKAPRVAGLKDSLVRF